MNSPSNSKAVLFIHGLGGDLTTWGEMPALLEKEEGFNWDLIEFTYPTPTWGIRLFPFIQHKYSPIQILADSLKTEIDEKFSQYEEIVLVAHSLGGLIARQYLLSESIANRLTKIRKLVLYAVPNLGSSLALISRELSIGANAHVGQLCKNSDFLDLLKVNWARSAVEDGLDITVVVGANDHIVSLDSAVGMFRNRTREPKVIAEANHKNIVKPKSTDDLAFVILKNVLKKKNKLNRSQLKGSLNVQEWRNYKENSSVPFELDEKRTAQLKDLSSHIGRQQQAIRVVGLSGLGKTRLILEAVTSQPELEDEVVYYDAAGDGRAVLRWLQDCIPKKEVGTLVVDNCSPALHVELAREIYRSDSAVCLITADYSYEKISETPILKLERFDDVIIERMLAPIYKSRIDDFELRKIVRFAQGFPRLAVMLADARLNAEGNMGALNDDLIANRLLWGSGQPSEEQEQILQGCALFEHFGIEAEVSPEFEFIAAHAVGIEREKFYGYVQDFVERGIIDKRGRYGQVVPKPLAIRLAAKWWQRSSREKQLKVINSLPAEMEQSFCDQIARLDFLPEVKVLTERLCGPQGPFGQAEVILSEKGSRLFRSLVEVNPDATADAIDRVLSKISSESIFSIKGPVRRNLVWALEKLAFRENTFARAASCLFLLADQESETWSNNASGIFSQLFRLRLSGTAAPPSLKFSVIQNLLARRLTNGSKVITEALRCAIEVHGGSRTVGAEYQGSSAPILEWEPKIWQEVYDYLDKSVAILLSIFIEDIGMRREIKKIFGLSIRNLVSYGRISLLDQFISKIIQIDGIFWIEALESINNTLEFDMENLSSDARAALMSWKRTLDGTDSNIADKIIIQVIDAPYEHSQSADGKFLDIAALRAEDLATQISKTPEILFDLMPILLGPGKHNQTYVFASKLGSLSESTEIIDSTISFIIEKSPENIKFALGLLSGVFKKSRSTWKKIVTDLALRESLQKYSINFLKTGEIDDEQLQFILDLRKKSLVSVDDLRGLSYGGSLDHVPVESCIRFVEILIKGADRDDIYWLTLDILFMYCHGNKLKRDQCALLFEEIVLKCNLDTNQAFRDYHEWGETCKWLADQRGSEFSVGFTSKICKKLLGSTDFNHDLIRIAKPVLARAIGNYAMETWEVLADCILKAEGISRMYFQWLFESENTFGRIKNGSLIAHIPKDEIFEWCHNHLDIGPEFVARVIDVFQAGEDETPFLNPMVITLLDKFGANEHVGNELIANTFSRGWTGSRLPYLMDEIRAIEPLESTTSPNVSAWAKKYIASLKADIEREKLDEEENSLKF
ncbi:hypothetical protein [Rugamonas apoptosis]|uniref:Uncharacterized protein n=1 Tax=Rugamonas apoptosis TaxID=2758570 RepID=A0A7W2IKC2_9BURK|nr:hypothetical protein [Rugamonas apoptosis]MBA5687394.1 hypothetical protein [Rugamonas apoptosis]